MSLIRLEGLTKHYGERVVALDGLDLELEPGIIGLVGANGAGKTTLLRILLGLLPPTAGRAFVFDMDVAAHGPQIREWLGYMPEHDCLPPDTSATEFVTHMARLSGLPASAARERTADVLRHVGLYEERYRAIGGYSTGMRQRVKLAQALVHDPRLVLLDEPTNGLDPAGREEMLDLVERTGRQFGISILLASHLLGEIERVCDHLVAIDAGRLLSSAPLATFTARTGTLAVEVLDGEERLVERLAAAGVPARAVGRTIHIGLDGRTGRLGPVVVHDLVRDAIAELGLGLVRLEPERRSLEDLFREGGGPEATAGTAGGDGAAVAGTRGGPLERSPGGRP